MVDCIQARIEEKCLGGRIILRNLHLNVAEGEFVAITGPSGCGKSTLLTILAGLDSDYKGEVQATGRLGIVFQEPRLLPWYSVAKNIALAAPTLSAAAIAGIFESCNRFEQNVTTWRVRDQPSCSIILG